MLPDKNFYTSDEFLAMTEHSDKRQELIHGEIYDLAAPGRIHQTLVARLHYMIFDYIRNNHGNCEVIIAPFDVKLTEDTTVQPDVMVICDPSKLDERKCNGAPDWIIEITSSNYKTDYSEKLELYKTSGVKEYWIVNPKRKTTIVLFFEQNPGLFMLYHFNQNIPVNIYKNKPVQLEINIEKLLNL